MCASQNSNLTAVLHAGTFLLDSNQSPGPRDLKNILLSRLAQFYAAVDRQSPVDQSDTVEALQLETAQAALFVLENVQQILSVDNPANSVSTHPPNLPGKPLDDPSKQAPAIGTRDLAELRTLLSVVFRWGVDPLLHHLVVSWPTKAPARTGPHIIDLTSVPDDYVALKSIVSHLMALLFPDGVDSCLPQTLITTILLDRHVSDLLKPCLALGWLPESLASDVILPVGDFQPLVLRLLAILPPSQTISALGAVLSSTPTPPLHVRKSCTTLMSRQLLRPEGVRGLCASVFGEQDGPEDFSLEKYEHVAQILSTPPAWMKSEEYFWTVIPRLLALAQDKLPFAYRRSAGFTVSHMLALGDKYNHRNVVFSIVHAVLHNPFNYLTIDLPDIIASRGHSTYYSSTALSEIPSSPTGALSIITTLLLNTDPSPTLISTILSPIAPLLYSLLNYLDKTKASDPILKQSLRGLLSTWGRVIESQEGIELLWKIIVDERAHWQADISGEIERVEKSADTRKLMLTPEDIRRADDTGELDIDMLDLYPDPRHFVQFLKSLDRSDISSELFVKLLDLYRESKATHDEDPLRAILYLQLIMQMQSQLSGTDSSSNVLGKPEHILSFVKHALEYERTSAVPQLPKSNSGDGLRMEELRIVSEQEEGFADQGDSDDEAPDNGGVSAEDEMADTAVSLLLATLEANLSLSARTAPMLNEIFDLLEPWANNMSHPVRPVAREARMVMTARLASTSTKWSSSRTKKEERAQDVYQKALKLLQDPILPVRAHGLLLLRQLVSSQSSSTSSGKLDSALVPAILSIFMQSVQDDDSYIFLNAVQGLAAMVDTFGKDVLKGLVDTYSKNLSGLSVSNLTQQDVDTKIRVGEALSQVIRRCGEALGIYTDTLVPPLMNIFRSPAVPTVIRSSSISLLTDCVKTNQLALSSYSADLASAMIDLLQIESVSAYQQSGVSTHDGTKRAAVTIDSNPVIANSKLPPLRRAALHFLSLLVNSTTERVYESGFETKTLSEDWMKRGRITLSYLASTDEDGVVRVMAREAVEGIDQLRRAYINIS